MSDGPDFLRASGEAEARLVAEYGSQFYDWSEDGGVYAAFGHMDPERFLALGRAWAREVWGMVNSEPTDLYEATADDVQHLWSVQVDDDWWAFCDGDEPNKVAVTVLDR